MAGFIDFLLVLLFVVVPVGAVCTQVVPAHLGEVRFRDTDLPHSWALVAQYAQGTFEQRFGYPTGYFYVDDKRSQEPVKILMREAQPAGVITDGCSMQLSAMSLSGFDAGCAAGCIGLFMIATIGAPFFIVSALDRFYRLVLRSRVDIELRQAGPDVIASFSFYGPGGYLLRSRYSQVFEKPVLPTSLSAAPAATVAQRPTQPRASAGPA